MLKPYKYTKKYCGNCGPGKPPYYHLFKVFEKIDSNGRIYLLPKLEEQFGEILPNCYHYYYVIIIRLLLLYYYHYGSTEEAHGGVVRCFSPRCHIMPK